MERQAFSLVELSIVLVILGLLTGGILTGQSLIRAAELRSVTTEFQKYQTAVNTFRDKYFYLPGDMPNATNFWGAAASCPGTNATPSTDTKTCNGNGNGLISPAPGYGNEYFRFWQHLANAGLIEGTYTGVQGPDISSADAVIGSNVPASKLGNGGWFAANAMTAASHAHLFDGTYTTRLIFGAKVPNTTTSGPIMTADEQWNIDKKIDDEIPGSGRIMAFKSSSTQTPGCTTSDDPMTATYSLSSSGILCSITAQPGW